MNTTVSDDFDGMLFDVLDGLNVFDHPEPTLSQSVQDLTWFTVMSWGMFLVLGLVHGVMQGAFHDVSGVVLTLSFLVAAGLIGVNLLTGMGAFLLSPWLRRNSLRARVERRLMKVLLHTSHAGLKERLGLFLPHLHDRRIPQAFVRRLYDVLQHSPDAYREWRYAEYAQWSKSAPSEEPTFFAPSSPSSFDFLEVALEERTTGTAGSTPHSPSHAPMHHRLRDALHDPRQGS